MSEKAVGIIGLKDGQGVLQQAPLEYCNLKFPHPKNKKLLIYVTRNARLGVAYCHALLSTPAHIASAIEALEAGYAMAKSRRLSQLTPDELAAGHGQSTSKMDAGLAELNAYDDTVHGVYEGIAVASCSMRWYAYVHGASTASLRLYTCNREQQSLRCKLPVYHITSHHETP